MRGSGARPKHAEVRALVRTERGGESRRATGHLPTQASPTVLAPTCACSCREGAVARLRPRAADLTPPRSKPPSPCAPPGTAGSRARCLTFPGKAFFPWLLQILKGKSPYFLIFFSDCGRIAEVCRPLPLWRGGGDWIRRYRGSMLRVNPFSLLHLPRIN